MRITAIYKEREFTRMDRPSSVVAQTANEKPKNHAQTANLTTGHWTCTP